MLVFIKVLSVYVFSGHKASLAFSVGCTLRQLTTQSSVFTLFQLCFGLHSLLIKISGS